MPIRPAVLQLQHLQVLFHSAVLQLRLSLSTALQQHTQLHILHYVLQQRLPFCQLFHRQHTELLVHSAVLQPKTISLSALSASAADSSASPSLCTAAQDYLFIGLITLQVHHANILLYVALRLILNLYLLAGSLATYSIEKSLLFAANLAVLYHI